MEAHIRVGDVLLPLKGQEAFNLIYELVELSRFSTCFCTYRAQSLTYRRNLPNIPLTAAMDTGDLLDGQVSSTYVSDRSADNVPLFISAALLDLHYVCLLQARAFRLLSSGGAVLSSMGGRTSFEVMLKLADAAGYVGRILSLSWKEQSEPESVIGGYAEYQKKGLGPVSHSKVCSTKLADPPSFQVLLLSYFGPRARFSSPYACRCWALCGTDWTRASIISPRCSECPPEPSGRSQDRPYSGRYGQCTQEQSCAGQNNWHTTFIEQC